MSLVSGGCLCGGVRYAVADVPLRQVVCHCRNCQRQSGSAFSTILVAPTEALEVQGETRIYPDRGDSGNRVDRHLCGRCGSSMFSAVPSRPDLRYIKAGTLDDPSIISPKLHLWCESAWPSTHIPAEATTLPKGVPQTG